MVRLGKNDQLLDFQRWILIFVFKAFEKFPVLILIFLKMLCNYLKPNLKKNGLFIIFIVCSKFFKILDFIFYKKPVLFKKNQAVILFADLLSFPRINLKILWVKKIPNKNELVILKRKNQQKLFHLCKTKTRKATSYKFVNNFQIRFSHS